MAQPLVDVALTDAISAAMVALYAEFYEHDRTHRDHLHQRQHRRLRLGGHPQRREADQIAAGRSADVIDGRVAFQEGIEDEFTAAIERLTNRPVTAFLSANQTAPGIACELFFLEAPPASVIPV